MLIFTLDKSVFVFIDLLFFLCVCVRVCMCAILSGNAHFGHSIVYLDYLNKRHNTLIWHCVKSVQIRSFFWSVFSCIQSKYRNIPARKNSAFGHFSCSVELFNITFLNPINIRLCFTSNLCYFTCARLSKVFLKKFVTEINVNTNITYYWYMIAQY